jgi:ATP phosphoribosyltransferase
MDAKGIAIALPKGRLFPESVGLFSRLGVTAVEALREGRRLMAEDPERGWRFLCIRAGDVPTYVEHGAADAGIAGKDQLLEQQRDVYEPLDLRFGQCRLVVAEPAALGRADDPRRWSSIRVATKYPNLTERHFAARGVQVEVLMLGGSIELAPLVGLAERVVDLVDTGRTLRENGLVEVEEIARSSARLVVNRASLKTKHAEMRRLIEALQALVGGGGGADGREGKA